MPIARLELSTDPSQLASLKAALEGTNVATSSEPSLITSIHYDTSDRKLHQHGLSLRIEQDDTHRVQVLRRLGLILQLCFVMRSAMRGAPFPMASLGNGLVAAPP